MKPFDIEKAKQGHPVCTRGGRDVELLKFDLIALMKEEKIVGVIKYDNHEEPKTWLENGQFDSERGHSFDLFLKSEQKEGWVNVYKDMQYYSCGEIHDTKEDALRYADNEHLIDTVKIKWEE